jgi:hypothetical protein
MNLWVVPLSHILRVFRNSKRQDHERVHVFLGGAMLPVSPEELTTVQGGVESCPNNQGTPWKKFCSVTGEEYGGVPPPA